MASARTIRWTVVLLLAAAVIIAAGMFGLASHKPTEYHPFVLSPQQQDQVVAAFLDHVKEFGNDAGTGQPFQWTITAGQANAYLASMDAIASLPGSPSYPTERLEEAGFTGPAVAMSDGVLTLMVQSKEYDKILSLDLGFQFNEEGNMTARIRGMRVGALPVPPSMLADKVQQVRGQLVEQLGRVQTATRSDIGQVPVQQVAKVLRALLDALDGKYIRPELVWHVGARHRVLLERIDLTPGGATLHLAPVSPAGPAAPTAPASGGAGGRRP